MSVGDGAQVGLCTKRRDWRQGHVPWDEVAQACRDIGFTGPFVIESFTNKVKSIAKAAAIWRTFAVSQDALAEDGLRHLRALLPQ